MGETLGARQYLAIGNMALHVQDEDRRFAVRLWPLFHLVRAVHPVAVGDGEVRVREERKRQAQLRA
jgi:hypothetical protein